jgi:hypothetical protein
MIYDNICKFLEENLGEGNYIIKYNNNKDFDWKSLITDDYVVSDEEKRPILAVLRVDNVDTTYLGDTRLNNEQISVTFAIPNNIKVVQRETLNLNTLRALDGSVVAGDTNSQAARLMFGSCSDGDFVSADFNNVEVDVVLKTMLITASVYDNLVSSDDISVTINSQPILAKVNITYGLRKSIEGRVYKSTTDATTDGTVTQINDELNIVCMAIFNNTLLSTLMNEERSKKNYTIVYNNGIIERTLTLQLQGITENTNTGGFLQVTLSFVNGSKNYLSNNG